MEPWNLEERMLFSETGEMMRRGAELYRKNRREFVLIQLENSCKTIRCRFSKSH